ncbi:MAG: hypothetical protein ACLP5E_14365 [Streptosporangiaceae bacterium]
MTSSGVLPTLGGMTRELPDEVLNLLDYQAGVLSRAQAQRAGMTGKQIDTAARSGRCSGGGSAVQARLGRAAAPLRTYLPDSRLADSRLTSPPGRSTQPPVA